VIELRGHAAPTSVAIEAIGTMDLALIAPLLANRILYVDLDVGDSTRVGGVELNVTVTYDAGAVQANVDPLRCVPISERVRVCGALDQEDSGHDPRRDPRRAPRTDRAGHGVPGSAAKQERKVLAFHHHGSVHREGGSSRGTC
jgi:hypothetical protein